MAPFTYGSLCSGIGSEVVAWEPLGWSCSWFAEIEPFCCSLLKEKYPNVPNLGDIRRIGNAKNPRLIVGGTPCQSFSINAKREGLADERGRLSLEFIRIVRLCQPAWVLWENVPNALRVDKGRAFLCIVHALAKCGYGWCYRILDLRRFGIPQRRMRLFLVGYHGDYRPTIAALLGRQANGSNCRKAKKAWKESVARIDGWAGDETPKRGQGVCPTLKSGQGGEGVGIIEGSRKLRKLTVGEYEMLQGFPIGYTGVFYKRKLASPTMRQRALGNAFPPPILAWIGRRIGFVDQLLTSGYSLER